VGDVVRTIERFRATIALSAKPGDGENRDAVARRREMVLGEKPSLWRKGVWGNRTVPLGKHSLRMGTRKFSWIAFVVAVILGVGLPAFILRRDATPSVAQHYHTGNGQQATVRLADGSVLILAPATSVDVRSTGLEVTGEVYVAITPHAARPVTVQTANAVVRVLGTSFVVRHYADELSTRVVVEDGRVTVQARTPTRHMSAPTVLSAQMIAQVADSSVTVQPSISTREYVEWTRGTLVFNRVALGTVVTDLARAYGAEIRVPDTTLAKYLMRMDVTVADDSLGQVLEGICRVTNAHYTQVGHAYVLAPGRSNGQLRRPAPVRRLFPQPEHAYGR
jgi:ferric-dicitrate binding protein FerR (iron transport regulator)